GRSLPMSINNQPIVSSLPLTSLAPVQTPTGPLSDADESRGPKRGTDRLSLDQASGGQSIGQAAKSQTAELDFGASSAADVKALVPGAELVGELSPAAMDAVTASLGALSPQTLSALSKQSALTIAVADQASPA